MRTRDWHGRFGLEHGGKDSPEYALWCRIKGRCYNPNYHTYRYYGGRGITMDPRWRESFPQFLADVGKRPAQHLSLDRINNDGHYEPGNVRWATKSQQAYNRRPKGTA